MLGTGGLRRESGQELREGLKGFEDQKSDHGLMEAGWFRRYAAVVLLVLVLVLSSCGGSENNGDGGASWPIEGMEEESSPAESYDFTVPPPDGALPATRPTQGMDAQADEDRGTSSLDDTWTPEPPRVPAGLETLIHYPEATSLPAAHPVDEPEVWSVVDEQMFFQLERLLLDLVTQLNDHLDERLTEEEVQALSRFSVNVDWDIHIQRQERGYTADVSFYSGFLIDDILVNASMPIRAAVDDNHEIIEWNVGEVRVEPDSRNRSRLTGDPPSAPTASDLSTGEGGDGRAYQTESPEATWSFGDIPEVATSTPRPTGEAGSLGQIFPTDVAERFIRSCLRGSNERECRCGLAWLQDNVYLDDYMVAESQILSW